MLKVWETQHPDQLWKTNKQPKTQENVFQIISWKKKVSQHVLVKC